MRQKSRAARLAVLGLALVLAVGCASFSDKTAQMRAGYGKADFASAESAVDAMLSRESGVNEKEIRKTGGVSDKIRPGKGDVNVLLLEKAMLRLARGDAESAVKILRACRDELDRHFVYDTTSFIKDIGALLADDTVRDYSGADYEHVMVRAMLAVADLMSGGGDAYAYAIQVGEKQEEIIGSPLGEMKGDKAYKPRERYRRVGFGAYVQGFIREDKLVFDEARLAYARAVDFEGGGHPVFGAALDRVNSRKPSEGQRGYLHVLDFAGRGPYLVENKRNPTSDAIKIAGFILLVMNRNLAVFTQAPVPIPEVYVQDSNPAPLIIEADGAEGETLTVLDVNRIAKEQNEANMGWTIARALVRRTVKMVGSQVVGKAAASGMGGRGEKELIGDLITIAASAAWTATENADTRSWSTLPAQVRTVRLELAPGQQKVRLGKLGSVDVRIAPGHSTYLLVVRPTQNARPAIVVDRYSRL